MADTNSVKWTLTVQVDGGPTVSATDTLSPTAYQRIALVLDKAPASGSPTPLIVNLPPSIQLLILKANKYDKNSLTYEFEGASGATPLTAPVIQFATTAKSVTLTNSMTTDTIAIEILVASDAVAPQQS